MLNLVSKIMRITTCTVAILLVLTWISMPVVAVIEARKVKTVDSQREEFTSSENESTTPTVENETLIGPKEPEDLGEDGQVEEVPSESVAEEEDKEETRYPETVHEIALTDREKEIFATIIYLEGGGESYECQMAIGSVILNRLAIGYWGDTLEEVLYTPYQFSPADRISTTTPTQKQRDIVDQLLSKGTTMPYYVLYFRAWYYFDWAIPYTNIGDVYFSYVERDV